MAPLPYYGSVFQQQQARVAANDGLERGLVGEAERVFRARDVGPVVYVFLGGGGKAIKWYLPLLC